MEKIKISKISPGKIEQSDKEKLVQEEVKVGIEKKQKFGFILGALTIIVAGVISGYFLSQGDSIGVSLPGKSESKKVVGSGDTKIFKDTAEGILEKGGIDGEGTHKLIRPGGESQTVYLTSSMIDLDQFVGGKVKVWGETQAAQKAGWFMDVGKLEVID